MRCAHTRVCRSRRGSCRPRRARCRTWWRAPRGHAGRGWRDPRAPRCVPPRTCPPCRGRSRRARARGGSWRWIRRRRGRRRSPTCPCSRARSPRLRAFRPTCAFPCGPPSNRVPTTPARVSCAGQPGSASFAGIPEAGPFATHEEAAMSKRFWISVVVTFVAAMALDFVVHGLLLGRDYAPLTPRLFRAESDAQVYFPYMLLAHVFMAIGITWLYRVGRANRPWAGQGLRFGLALAFYAVVPTYLIYYAVQPLPPDLVAKQLVFGTVAAIILGLVAAAVNRDPRVARPTEEAAEEDLSPIPR